MRQLLHLSGPDLIASGAIDVGPLLSHIFPVEEIDEAMHLAHEPHDAQALKVSIDFTGFCGSHLR